MFLIQLKKQKERPDRACALSGLSFCVYAAEAPVALPLIRITVK